jgi:hypothetical protein
VLYGVTWSIRLQVRATVLVGDFSTVEVCTAEVLRLRSVRRTPVRTPTVTVHRKKLPTVIGLARPAGCVCGGAYIPNESQPSTAAVAERHNESLSFASSPIRAILTTNYKSAFLKRKGLWQSAILLCEAPF